MANEKARHLKLVQIKEYQPPELYPTLNIQDPLQEMRNAANGLTSVINSLEPYRDRPGIVDIMRALSTIRLNLWTRLR